MVSVATGTKKKRVSKKTKRSWRKHVDIKDVEQYLDEKRADERLGQPLETIPDTQLFKIEKKPKVKLTKLQKRKLLSETLPKCFSILQPLTKVPDPIGKRNVKTSLKEPSNISRKIAERKRCRVQMAKNELTKQSRKINKARKKAEKLKTETRHDVWAIEESDLSKALKNEWFESDTVRNQYRGLGQLRKKPPVSITAQKSVHPSIETPHPGISYNPSLGDHQNLLQEVTKKETEIIKKAAHIERVTSHMFQKLTPTQATTQWIEEMSQGLPTPTQKEVDSGSDSEYKAINPPTKNKKKDLKTRRKQREHNKLETDRRMKKIEKKKLVDIQKIKVLGKQIQKHDATLKRKAEAVQKLKEEKKLEPKRLSIQKYEEPNLDFNLPEDISGSLLNIKTEGNLLKDRFKSLQKRNILEPGLKRYPHKRKMKTYEKSTHKMGWEPKGY